MLVAPMTHPRIVVTGGPGAGKTTAIDLFRRELGPRLVTVPEAATMLLGGGFPRPSDPPARRAVQLAIYHVQHNLEAVQLARYPRRVLLCDRGTIDGAAYWPAPADEFFAAVGSSMQAELARYDEVIFFETAAVGGLSIEGGNPARVESNDEAVVLDARLRALWSQHPRFTLVAHEASFLAKIGKGLAKLSAIVDRLAPE